MCEQDPKGTAPDTTTQPLDLDQILTNGDLLYRAGKLDDAIEHYNTVLLALPSDVRAHEGLGRVYSKQHRLDEAIRHFETSLKIEFTAPCASALGGTYGQVGRYEDAIATLNRCLRLSPNMASGRWNRAAINLVRGHWKDGWKDYRYGLIARMRFPRALGPEWNGTPIPGKRLLVHCEQGHGDTIWALRLLQRVKELSRAHIVLEVQEPLYALCSMSPQAYDELIPQHTDLSLGVSYDYRISLMDLPWALKMHGPGDVPPFEPYLTPSQTLVDAWGHGVEPGRKVGIVWSGNPAHANDHNRSIPVDQLSPLAGIPFVSLQKGGCGTGLDLQRLGDDLHDFAATAAVIANLERVISVDTAVAHLAGAMGKECTLLLPYVPDFRWGLESDRTPWYPSVTMIRQDSQGEWASVLYRALVDDDGR